MSKPLPHSDLISLGKIVRPFGIRGGLKAQLFNPSTEILKKGASVFLTTSKGSTLFVIKDTFGNGKFLLGGVESRNDAERWVGAELQIDRSQLPGLSEEEAYLSDLLDMTVVSPEGLVYGKIVGFSHNSAQELMELRSEASPSETFLVPLVPEWMVEINYDDEKIIMDLPEGLVG